jgi:putative sigma-54 modulation protein
VRGITRDDGQEEVAMKTEVRAVHFNLHENAREYLDKKIERLEYAKDMITDLMFVLTREKNFKAECTINFRWGRQDHLVEEDFDLNTAIDKLVDKVEHKISKEKEKVQEKK